MAATYDTSLPSDRDWVRFLIGDTNTSNASISDEEIDALLTEEPNKYLAAYRAGSVIAAKGKGVVSKSVESLSISFGDSPESTYRAHLRELKAKGNSLLLKKPRAFRVL